ncbi:MAG: hypothetical protein GF355_14405, partial [Candidatus Eisenbacteria bacterium]|nr:hypothetical protein [Candidatus Eisenbacteria bacterium]
MISDCTAGDRKYRECETRRGKALRRTADGGSVALNLLIHMPNWIGDAVMSLPAVEAAAADRAWRVTLLGRREPLALAEAISGLAGTVRLPARPSGLSGLGWFRDVARELRRGRYAAAVTLSPSFSSAALIAAAGARLRVGWTGQGRSLLLN